uniref:Uncharacterized protein n=1 Tax=Glossina pallidipes TaxID=7398 RepID=A0A1B0AH49_GLOPL
MEYISAGNLYVAMVQMKSKDEYEMQELICVLCCETLQRALKVGSLDQEQVDAFDPALMFSIPRVAIVKCYIWSHLGISVWCCLQLRIIQRCHNSSKEDAYHLLRETIFMEGKKEMEWYWEKIQETLNKIGPKKTIIQWKNACASLAIGRGTLQFLYTFYVNMYERIHVLHAVDLTLGAKYYMSYLVCVFVQLNYAALKQYRLGVLLLLAQQSETVETVEADTS